MSNYDKKKVFREELARKAYMVYATLTKKKSVYLKNR